MPTKDPAAASEQLLWPVVAAYEPSEHGSALVAPLLAPVDVPIGAVVHAVLPVRMEKLPLAHEIQVEGLLAPTVFDAVPAGHAVKPVAALLEPIPLL